MTSLPIISQSTMIISMYVIGIKCLTATTIFGMCITITSKCPIPTFIRKFVTVKITRLFDKCYLYTVVTYILYKTTNKNFLILRILIFHFLNL